MKKQLPYYVPTPYVFSTFVQNRSLLTVVRMQDLQFYAIQHTI